MALQRRHSTGRARRKTRVRMQIKGTAEKPRLSVFRSNQQVICQVIDDVAGITLAAACGLDIKNAKGTKTEQATQVGELLAERALAKNVTTVVFDRNGYRYHGRVKAVAEAMRQKGLQF